MDQSDGPTTRSAKRRRVSVPITSRYTSPDELAGSPEHSSNHTQQRTSSNSYHNTPDRQPRHPSYSRARSGGSPDELDHTRFHTFYRASSFSKSVQPLLHIEPAVTPEYSRISTPIATPEPALFLAPPLAKYVPYKEKMVLRGHRRGVAAVRFSPDGRLIASCSADATIRIWDTATGKHLHTLEGHLAGISTIAWSPDSKTIASGSDDKSIRLWDISTGKPHPHPLIGHHSYIYSLAFSPKGNMLVSGSYDEAVFLWDIRTTHILRSLPAHSDPVGGVDFIRDGTLIVSCAGDGLIRIWDTATGQCLRTLVHEDNAPVTSVRFSPNGKFVLAWTLDDSIRLWNYVEGRCVKTYQGHANAKYSIGGAFGTFGHEAGEVKAFVVSGSEEGDMLVWDVTSKEVLQRIGGAHEGVVLGVDTKEGRMVSGGLDGCVRVWVRDEGVEDEEAVKEDAVVGKRKSENGGIEQGGTENGVVAMSNGDGEVFKME